MKKRPLDKNYMLEVHAARRFHELLRQDRARDAQWLRDQEKARARADRKAAWIDGLVSTAERRIAACKAHPTPLTVHQMRQIAEDQTKPARVRAQAAALVLKLTGWDDDEAPGAPTVSAVSTVAS